MTQLSTIDKKITDVLGSRNFTVSAEVIPPRNGQSQEKILNQIKSLAEVGVDFISVTKGAGGSLRGGSLPIALAIKDQLSIPCIAHFTCRDLVKEEVENQLVDHSYFGIRNILALRGDPPMGVEDWTPRAGGHSYAYELMQQIGKLNQGEYLERKGFKSGERSATDFCIGAAVYPEHPGVDERLDFFKCKIDAGAEWAITQMIFDADKYRDFLNLCSQNNLKVPILPGLRILHSQKQAKVMEQRFGCSVPKDYFDKLPAEKDPDSLEQVLDAFHVMVEKFQALDIPGIHLFVLNDTLSAVRVIKHYS